MGWQLDQGPIGLYELLRNSDLDFPDHISVNLDEYVVAPTDEHSYRPKRRTNYSIKAIRTVFPTDGLAKRCRAEVERYEGVLQRKVWTYNYWELEVTHILVQWARYAVYNTHKSSSNRVNVEAKRFFEKEEGCSTQCLFKWDYSMDAKLCNCDRT